MRFAFRGRNMKKAQLPAFSKGFHKKDGCFPAPDRWDIFSFISSLTFQLYRLFIQAFYY